MAGGADLESFVREHIPSVWALELLLILRRDEGRCWPPAELVSELRGSLTLVNQNLPRLQRSGLVLKDDAGCYRYAPASQVLGALCDRLEADYRERPVAVINMIAKPNPLQSLADAFKFRGDGK